MVSKNKLSASIVKTFMDSIKAAEALKRHDKVKLFKHESAKELA